MALQASYLHLLNSGKLEERVKQARESLSNCRICPHQCGVNRLEDERGFCRTGARAIVSGHGPHFGEEPPISGTRGSGTVFFSGCNMRCIYCQNYEVSQEMEGHEVTPEFLAFFLLALQEQGCHNINLVTPSHVVPQFLEGLLLAAREGLHLPVVYNSGGYDGITTLRLLDGIIDIYMPDIKYSDNRTGLELSGVKSYWTAAKNALLEMYRQVGNLQLDSNGVACKGLLIRHLVLPGGLSGTRKVMKFIATEISRDAVINIMDQYRPCGRASEHPPLDRRLRPEEFKQAIEWAKQAGLTRIMPLWQKDQPVSQ